MEERNAKSGLNFDPFILGFLIFGIILVYALSSQYWRPRMRYNGCNTACKSNLKNLGTALEMYSVDSGGRYPPSLEYLTRGGNYLHGIPSCPQGPAPYSYTFSTKPDAYTLNCTGVNYHESVGIKTGYPQYSSNQGLIER